ncbi:MAG: hypothetical protein ACRC6I_06285, partial [Paracoccaceae bacterium]
MKCFVKIGAQAVVFALIAVGAHAQEELGLTVLDLTITQDGAPVTINEAPSDWPLSFSIGIGPRPFSITLPLAGCDPDLEGTYVRAYDYDAAAGLVAALVNVRDTSRVDDPMEITFPPGFGMAAEAGVQRVLYADDPKSARFEQGFNYFFAERYSDVTTDTVTLTIDRVEGAD